jgi:hypothetical protein
MPNWEIDRLQLEITGAAGHEHRIGGIAQRAAELFAEQIDLGYSSQGGGPSRQIQSVTARPVGLDLSRTSDEQAARSIAGAWMEALALRLKI